MNTWIFQVISSLSFPHQNPVNTFPLPHTCYMPAHLILLDMITRIIFGEWYGSWSFSVLSFLHSPVTSSLLGPNILLNTVFFLMWYSINIYGRILCCILFVACCELLRMYSIDDSRIDEYWTLVEWNRRGTTEVFGEKPVPVLLCSPQIPPE